MKKYKIVIFLGPPGSGKGTQAALLCKKLGYEYIGSGDLLRARTKIKDYTGKKIKETIDQGKRIPTPVIFKIWMDRLESFRNKKNLKGFVIDGSPRTVSEAEMLEQALEWYGWSKNKKVFFIDIPLKEIVNRLTKRKICSKCGRIIPYFGALNNLKKCDKCGGKLVKRADDNLRGVQERLRWFKSEVLPMVEYYKKKKMIIDVNGDKPIEKVAEEILRKLGK